MTAQRIDQLRETERLAVAACAAYVTLVAIVEDPKRWREFEHCVKLLGSALEELLQHVGEPLDAAAPVPERVCTCGAARKNGRTVIDTHGCEIHPKQLTIITDETIFEDQ